MLTKYQKLYHQTLAIRPKLIKLIEKYSQKKGMPYLKQTSPEQNRLTLLVDDFTQLNEKFIKARRDYEALLESSMSHPPGPSYHSYAPQIPQSYAPPGGLSYPPQPMPQGQQDHQQRYYTPGPAQGMH